MSKLQEFIEKHLNGDGKVSSENNKQFYIIAGETTEDAIFLNSN